VRIPDPASLQRGPRANPVHRGPGLKREELCGDDEAVLLPAPANLPDHLCNRGALLRLLELNDDLRFGISLLQLGHPSMRICSISLIKDRPVFGGG